MIKSTRSGPLNTANPAHELLSVIIPTANRPGSIVHCLQEISLQMQTVAGVEVLVSDDSANSDTRELVATQFPLVQWFAGPRQGPGANRNAGAAHARSHALVFVDDDCIPQPGWLDAYRESTESQAFEKTVFVGPTRWPGGLPSLRWEAPLNDSANGMPSCNFGLSSALFERVGGFDARFIPAFEDMEIQARLTAIQSDFCFLSRAVVHHAPRAIPSARRMAARWYPQVLYAIDLGAPANQLYLPFLRHVAGVISSRIREHAEPYKNISICPRYLAEFLWVTILLRGWIRQALETPRSKFWEQPENRAKVHGFGFGYRAIGRRKQP